MPGTAIGIKIPGPKTLVLHAEIQITEQEGRYSSDVHIWQPRPPEAFHPVVQDLQKFVNDAVNKLNGK